MINFITTRIIGVALAGALLPGFAPEAGAAKPKQVIVSVKIIEFQVTKGVDTGFSAYFQRTSVNRPFGQASAVNTGDLTFPTTTAAGITVFLDKLTTRKGEIEVVLQALVDENKAFILSKPKAMVMVGQSTPTIVETTQQIPYESTVVVGSTAVQITAFEDTGVKLEIMVPEIIDDDGNWDTHGDTYIRLDVKASVKEEGQRIVVALAGGGALNPAANTITVPEFIDRSIDTHVWVRHGQVLMLGGLFRNSESKNISTVPFLPGIDDVVMGALESFATGGISASPLSSIFGSRATTETRRELVFLIKCDIWLPSFTISDQMGFQSPLRSPPTPVPADRVTTVNPGGGDDDR